MIDGHRWSESLPRIIEAFFYVQGGRRDVSRAAHAGFLSAYGLQAAAVPLLELRPDAWDQPFHLT